MLTAKGNATRSRILETTVDLLVEGGRENVGLDAVLRATSISKSQLFHYFPGGKEELLRTATGRQMERALTSEVSAPGLLDSWEAWRAWIDLVIRLHLEQADNDSCQVAALAARSADLDLECRRLVGVGFEQWIQQIDLSLQSMQAKGLLRRGLNTRELASAVLASLEGGAVIDKATGSRDHLRYALEASYSYIKSFAQSSSTGVLEYAEAATSAESS
jgi:AcrR family transcriptional regulator